MTTRSVQVPTVDDVAAATRRIAPHLRPTPLEPSPVLGPGIGLKLETMLPTGSFKVRGALAALTRLHPGEAVVTASAGNHALGIAWAAARLDVRATVVCAETASPAKIDALRGLRVELVLHGESYDAAEAHALSLVRPGVRYVSAYNDTDVIAGQGSIVAELPGPASGPITIVTPVGGGGLAAGVGLAASRSTAVRVVGVQSEASPAMRVALDAGRIVRVVDRPSLADGLAGNLEPGSVTVDLVARHLDEVLLVSEEEIAAAIRFLAREHGLVVEGAGATGVAAVLAGRVRSDAEHVVVLVTGRNITLELFARILADE